MPYRIAFLSKFPPIEGGIAAKTFWLARGLAKRGHAVHIITNGISAGGEYRIQDGDKLPQDIPNLWVHRPPNDIPWHIPEDNENALALLDTTIDVIREYGIQILDTGYLVPYGILGHFAKVSTGVLHVLRHGGSDLHKFLKDEVFKTLLHEAISNADVVITKKSCKNIISPLTYHWVYQPPYIPDESVFFSSNTKRPRWRLASIGKINYYWQHKALGLIAETMGQLTPQFECWILGQGKGFSDFQNNISNKISSKIKWMPFVTPWKMPQILNKLDAIFMFESGLPYSAISNLVLEAIYSGVGIITDREDLAKTYRDVVALNENQVLVVQPTEVSSSAKTITQWINESVKSEWRSQQLETFQEYLSSNEKIYQETLSS